MSSSTTMGGFQLPLLIGRTAAMLARPLDLDGKEITLYRDNPKSKGFSTVLAIEDYLSLEGVPYQHEMRLTDNGLIPELHRPDTRQLQSVTFRLDSLQPSLLPDQLMDERTRVRLSKVGADYEDNCIRGDISAVPIRAAYTHNGTPKSMNEFTGGAWRNMVLPVREVISVKGTDLDDWVEKQEAIHALAARNADGSCYETSGSE